MRRCVLVVVLLMLTLPVFAQDAKVVNGVKQYIAQAGDSVGIACYPVDQPDQGVFVRANVPYPLASTIKIMILGVYAQGAASGRFDAAERVPLSVLDAYYLPGTDGGAQPAFLAAVPPDSDNTLSLADIVYGMIRYSSNAAADYLHSRMTDADFETLYSLIGVQNTDIPVSLLGLFLAQDNHETGISDSTLPRDQVRASAALWANKYVNDPQWRAAEQAYHQDNDKRYRALGKSVIDTQRIFFEKYDDQGTPDDFVRVMAMLQRGDTLPATAVEVMHAALSWPMEFDDNRAQFYSLGTKGGSLPGIITSAYFAHSRQGNPIVLALFYRDLPSARYLDWLKNFEQQELEWEVLMQGCGVLSS